MVPVVPAGGGGGGPLIVPTGFGAAGGGAGGADCRFTAFASLCSGENQFVSD
jgi:hypothetical protein